LPYSFLSAGDNSAPHHGYQPLFPLPRILPEAFAPFPFVCQAKNVSGRAQKNNARKKTAIKNAIILRMS